MGSVSVLYVTGTYGYDADFGPTRLVSPRAGLFLASLDTPGGNLPDDVADCSLTLAPNPAHATVLLTGAPASTTATLLAGLGRTVRTLETPTGTATLDLRGLAPGVYTVRAGAATRRLVIE